MKPGLANTESMVPLKAGPDSLCIDMPVITSTAENPSVGSHLQPAAAVNSAKKAEITGQQLPPRLRHFSMEDPRGWDFFDERMKNMRRLLQLTFLADMFSRQQAAVNKRFGLAKYCRWCTDDPHTCVGYGTLIRLALYLLSVCMILAIWFDALFILPKNTADDADFTQLPVKIAFFLFGIEVMTTMIFFARAASSFATRHISRDTVKKMTTGILIFSISLFWLSYSVVFFSFIFFKSGELNSSKGFPTDMYTMHKVWTGKWIDQPAFLLFYSSAMFIAFSVYIVSVRLYALVFCTYSPSKNIIFFPILFAVAFLCRAFPFLTPVPNQNSVFSFFIWCIWMQTRKLLNRMQKQSDQFKPLLLENLPLLLNEHQRLKQQWRLQIIVYILLDIFILVAFSLELQFIIFNKGACLVPIFPLLLFMFNVFVHLFSFLFGIAILNDSFSKIESAAWSHTGWKIAPNLRTPEQASALKDPEVGILLLGLSTNKLMFKIGPVTIDWAFIWTVSSLAATVYGLAIPTLGSLGNNRMCTAG